MDFENDENCDNAFAELAYSVESLDFELSIWNSIFALVLFSLK